MDQLLQSDDWNEIRKLRKGFAPKCGCLHDDGGKVVESELHAESLAKYFQEVQWAVRPVSVAAIDSPIGLPLPVETGPFNDEEIIAAASRLRRSKATGTDHVPAELWKPICRRTSPACRWATTLCNAIREHVMVPSSWHDASVTAVFNKGDPCKNYRPITVVSARYKLFAMALLRRLQNAGAEERIWPTQFAFRIKRGSADAIFVSRRLLDLTLADWNGTLVRLSLDWEKAFDSIPTVCFMLSKDLVYRLCFVSRPYPSNLQPQDFQSRSASSRSSSVRVLCEPLLRSEELPPRAGTDPGGAYSVWLCKTHCCHFARDARVAARPCPYAWRAGTAPAGRPARRVSTRAQLPAGSLSRCSPSAMP